MKKLIIILLFSLFTTVLNAQRVNCEYDRPVNPYFSKIEPSGYVGIGLTIGTFITVDTLASQVTVQQRNRIALTCMGISVATYAIMIWIENR